VHRGPLSSYLSVVFRRLFPESLFPRKLSTAAEGRLRLAQARAEEALVRTHVDNVLIFVDTLAEELSFDRAIDSYIRVMGVPEPLASTVATRALVALGQDLVTSRRRSRDSDAVASEAASAEDLRPRLRLNDAEATSRSATPRSVTPRSVTPRSVRRA
jgi:hypothetical protein